MYTFFDHVKFWISLHCFILFILCDTTLRRDGDVSETRRL